MNTVFYKFASCSIVKHLKINISLSIGNIKQEILNKENLNSKKKNKISIFLKNPSNNLYYDNDETIINKNSFLIVSRFPFEYEINKENTKSKQNIDFLLGEPLFSEKPSKLIKFCSFSGKLQNSRFCKKCTYKNLCSLCKKI